MNNYTIVKNEASGYISREQGEILKTEILSDSYYYLLVVHSNTLYFVEFNKYNKVVGDILLRTWSYGKYFMFMISKYDEFNNVYDFFGLSKVIRIQV